MDSWMARKRSREQDDPTESHHEPWDSGVAAPQHHQAPLLQYAGHSPPNALSPERRRLPPPPLHTTASAYGGAWARAQTGPIHSLSPEQEASGSERPRHNSLSRVELYDQAKRPRLESDQEHTRALPRAVDKDRSLPPIDTTRWTSNSQPHAAAAANCCSPGCEGKACSNARNLMRNLASELVLLDSTLLQRGVRSTKDPSDVDHRDINQSLQWALDLVRRTNITLRDQVDISTSLSPEPTNLTPEALAAMRKGHHHPGDEDRSTLSRHALPGNYPHPGFGYPNATTEEGRRNAFTSGMPRAGSPQRTASPSGSAIMPSQSPMQAPQSLRHVMLPSPSSMNFPHAANAPSRSSPSPSYQGSAQNAHLQDLQHQISVKTLAFQTLQREYDSLLQKLERQRTKCATLEKKFEVSDVEINSLTDEKEKLQSQVALLESQVEELQESRDEARQQLKSSKDQYTRILAMANRLETQSSGDKRRWESEKLTLEQRIRVLEEEMVTGTGSVVMADAPDVSLGFSSTGCPPGSSTAGPLENTPSMRSQSSSETINVLRTEIGRLRARTQSLETALRTMREESIMIQSAARQLVDSSSKIEKASQTVKES